MLYISIGAVLNGATPRLYQAFRAVINLIPSGIDRVAFIGRTGFKQTQTFGAEFRRAL